MSENTAGLPPRIDGDGLNPGTACERTPNMPEGLSGLVSDFETPNADRFVLVDYRRARTTPFARAMDVRSCEIYVTLQDDGRTVKVFLWDAEADQ
ncbi:hypothetical protein [Mycobacterium dioxanotrophicus]|nr:hypothetical protein [Mycobacterium dioxanotrophicus]